MAALLALAIGVPLGIYAATKHNTFRDHAAMGIAMTGVSIPRFVLAPLLVLVFALKLYVLPVARWETWRHMVLPVFCAGLPMAAYVARLARAGMLEVIRSDFVRTARAKGLSERRVLVHHVLRNSLIPIITLWGLDFAAIIGGGAILTESVFDIGGVGQYASDAIQSLDVPPVMAVTIFTAFFVVLFNTIVDIMYAWLDPRIRIG
jgi:oligopeptide transport system permease protein